MTIEVTVTNSPSSPESGAQFCHVAVFDSDIYGNKSNVPTELTQLAPGESKSVYIHDMRELRVYESHDELFK